MDKIRELIKSYTSFTKTLIRIKDLNLIRINRNKTREYTQIYYLIVVIIKFRTLGD